MHRSHLVLAVDRHRTCGTLDGGKVVQADLLSKSIADEDALEIELAGTVILIQHDHHIGIGAVLLELGCSNAVYTVADLTGDGLHRQVVGIGALAVDGDPQFRKALAEIGTDFGDSLQVCIDEIANLFGRCYCKLEVVTLHCYINRVEVAQAHGHLTEREIGGRIEVEISPQLLLDNLHGVGAFLIKQGDLKRSAVRSPGPEHPPATGGNGDVLVPLDVPFGFFLEIHQQAFRGCKRCTLRQGDTQGDRCLAHGRIERLMHRLIGLKCKYHDQDDQNQGKPLIVEKQGKRTLVAAVESFERSFGLVVDESEKAKPKRLLLAGIQFHI
ncbi:hypothetical protein SDC9_66180 [bioreactor metagenome]|uniref:Uncharacterized protein n=1 Tax=bioreactor metagenome TaxID=1076179 RepID=A0A644Y0J8_9ZZZZ